MSSRLLPGLLGLGAVAGIAVAAISAPVGILLLAVSASQDSDTGPNSGVLAEEAVPTEYLEYVRQAGDRCEGISAPAIAAQITAESAWDPFATSPVGAQGLAQFMPGTWGEWGTDYDGDGIANPWTPSDAIGSQADFMCHLYSWTQQQLTAGTISGDPLDLALAAYNAGPGAVQRFAGIPPYAETQGYVTRIRSLIATYTVMGAATGSGSGIVEMARTQLGVPYVWGGGNLNGPTRGGLDCSGLTIFAIYQATGITLPHLADSQARTNLGTTVPRDLASLLPGDLIAFSDTGGQRYQHVGIYIGDGQMIHAPIPGRSVEIASVTTPYWANQTWSVKRFT